MELVRDNYSEVLNRGFLKFAFVGTEVELMLLQQLQNTAGDLAVLFEGLYEDEDVVQIDHYHAFWMRSLKMLSIIIWKVAGLFVRLGNMTRGSYRLRLVRKAAFHLSPSFIWTLLKPHQTSSFVKYLALRSFAISSGISGRGYLFFMVMAFNAR